jgi:hypothetical protein
MAPPPSATSVSTQIDVEARQEHAFRVFTEGIGTWWDDDKHILRAPLAARQASSPRPALRCGQSAAPTAGANATPDPR